ncbi:MULTISPECIES: TnsD family Tn7-like transposition protein [Pseudomonas]|nr:MULTISPECIES: TnsD family Tn7-like transposition protein [Pseudomonas]MCE0940970.1 TnsD family transposase [Pseudomonas kurunegalensis]MDS9593089.1 TnsD family Tn7-like transposition protein [Pseudomonas sp. HTZ1]QKK99673.1 hypothetical protein GEV38_28495 [Pseudomonas sp. 13159349]
MNLKGKQLPLLHWLPDECLYSVCSRQHILWGNQSPTDTLSFLFGSGYKKFAHDFPSNLSLLIESAKSTWGTPEELISEHTIAPIFFPFQSSDHIQELKQALMGPKIGSMKYRLGLVTGRFGGAHPLKACVKCMATDRSVLGATYWHLSHQLPGVTTCPVHGVLLSESIENRQWSRGFQWLLPDELALSVTDQSAIDPATFEALQNMSELAVDLWKSGSSCQFDSTTVANVYKEAFSNFGRSQKSRDAAADRFAELCAMLKQHPPFTALPTTRKCAIGFISQMTRKPRGYCHPLKHLTLIWWLFGSLESFVKAYQHAANQQQLPDASFNDTVIKPVSRQGKKIGAQKPKKLFNDLKTSILGTLMTGTSKKEVCVIFEISMSTVNRLLRLNPMIDEEINKNSTQKKLDEKRTLWLCAVAKSPSASANVIKHLVPSVYAWLYRNDKSWLLSQTGSLPTGRAGNHSTIDWEARDENLSALVKKVLTMSSIEPRKIRKRDLYQMVPNLFSSLEQKQHYPKTRQLISKIFQ